MEAGYMSLCLWMLSALPGDLSSIPIRQPFASGSLQLPAGAAGAPGGVTLPAPQGHLNSCLLEHTQHTKRKSLDGISPNCFYLTGNTDSWVENCWSSNQRGTRQLPAWVVHTWKLNSQPFVILLFWDRVLATQAVPEASRQPKLPLNYWSSCLQPLRAGITNQHLQGSWHLYPPCCYTMS